MDDKKILRSTKTTLKSKVVKKNVKASVFTHLFSIEKYRRELYLCFHPRDGDVSDEDVKEYLSEYKKEVYNIMTYSIDHQKLATD